MKLVRPLALWMALAGIAVLTGCKDEKTQPQPAAAPAPAAPSEPAAEKAAPAPALTPAADAVVVTVNGQAILESKVAQEVEKRVQARLKMIPPGMEVPQERIQMLRDQTRRQVTEMLVDLALIEMALKEKNIQVAPEQAEQEMKKFAEENGLTLEAMLEQITASGMSVDDVKEQFLTRAKVEALMKAELGDLKATEAEAKTYYDEHQQEFAQPELVTASHILLRTQGKTEEEKAQIRQKMEGILQRARAGEDFAALAKEFSEDPGSKDRGGEYTFPRGQMVKPFEDAAFSLQNGQISDIVETQYGYHIIKRTDHKDAGTQSFDEVKETLIGRLTDQKEQEGWQQIKAKLRAAAKIEWSPEEQARQQAFEQQMQMMQQMRAAQPAPQPQQPPQPQQ
ncbi:MAG TPA: peptidylprolyl isomerase [Anaerohalosphaeraceae bacterium]|nr:peptidylprolyl isomerase [Anaerohalosphaeraceae bacterium]HOL88889.1 peptidylprolyl isomerase [Anaerohalosphaeraceae bacterium]HPP55731.1 peptidylprolyl isomerase [Anaerohalosphaeraceae bacterium]